MTLTLKLNTEPSVPLEAAAITPARLTGLDASKVAALPVLHGNEELTVGDFFAVQGKSDSEFRLEGDLHRVKHIGTGMAHGRLMIEGSVGAHLATGMSGGEIVVAGDVGDWLAPEMSGGRVIVKGDAGHMVGSAHRGSRIGILGGEIIVFGNVGNETGNTMRRGFIAVGGNAGDFAGVSMIAGSVIVLGELGIRTGAGMKRGTIVSMHDAKLLPTFRYACTYQPVFLGHYLDYLSGIGLPVSESQKTGRYRRWSGDSIKLNLGEVLLFDK
ncbi:MAG: formylmethanofuran dehydrogenase subunit C [Gammaproteobacteria bacterium]|nr:formylmethanofuran dehydrogenase subunit C [Gammaproteobacteria bacterium]